MSTPTTRRYARSLAEAFPREARHAYAIERGSRRMDSVNSVLLACAVGLMLALALALVHWWST